MKKVKKKMSLDEVREIRVLVAFGEEQEEPTMIALGQIMDIMGQEIVEYVLKQVIKIMDLEVEMIKSKDNSK